jgi:hypothetical protein
MPFGIGKNQNCMYHLCCHIGLIHLDAGSERRFVWFGKLSLSSLLFPQGSGAVIPCPRAKLVEAGFGFVRNDGRGKIATYRKRE